MFALFIQLSQESDDYECICDQWQNTQCSFKDIEQCSWNALSCKIGKRDIFVTSAGIGPYKAIYYGPP